MHNLEKLFVFIIIIVLVSIACLTVIGAPIATIVGGVIAIANPASPSEIAMSLTLVGVVIDVALLFTTLPILYYHTIRSLSAEKTYDIDYGGKKRRIRMMVGVVIFLIAIIAMALVMIMTIGYCFANPYDGISIGIATIAMGAISFFCTICSILIRSRW